jgi:hypothetical protein
MAGEKDLAKCKLRAIFTSEIGAPIRDTERVFTSQALVTTWAAGIMKKGQELASPGLKHWKLWQFGRIISQLVSV